MTLKALRSAELEIGGMTCVSCKNRIEKRLMKINGVAEADVDYAGGTARVVFDQNRVDLNTLIAALENMNYSAAAIEERRGARNTRGGFIGTLLIIAAVFLFMRQGGGFAGNIFNSFPQAGDGMGYWALFITGLLTSLHCAAMCGGINLSQSLGGKKPAPFSFSSLRAPALYNAGRIISYAVTGGAVGALGSAISFSGAARGAVQITAGVFMIILGINMFGAFKFARALMPRMPKFIAASVERCASGKGPLIVGLANGLMPCGPLQAMQIYALSAGSPGKGALATLVFGLGTAPLMFGIGAFSSLMSRKFAGGVLKFGSALVIVMGAAMLGNGAALSGIASGLPGGAALPAQAAAKPGGVPQEVTMNLTKFGGYSPITVRAGVPVRWTIHAGEGTLNGCNNAIVVPAFNIQKNLSPGDTVVEFTPSTPGKYVYSCWMGMIRSTITVVGDAPPAEAANFSEDLNAAGEGAALPAGCPCCAGGRI